MGAQIIENFSTIITSLAAAGAVFIAWKGLDTWKTQIRWQTDHELARKILVLIYSLRDAVSAARNPFIWSGEMLPEDGVSPTFPQTPEQQHAGQERAHQRRWEPIGKKSSEIYALLLEAEAVWGEELPALWRKIKSLQNELLSQTQLYLESNQPHNLGQTGFYDSKDEKKKSRRIVYSIDDENGLNDYSSRFSQAFSDVEEFLKKKLGHKK